MKLASTRLLVLAVLLMMAAGPVFALCTSAEEADCCCAPERSTGPQWQKQKMPCCSVSAPAPAADPVQTERSARSLDGFVLYTASDSLTQCTPHVSYVTTVCTRSGSPQPVSLFRLHAALLI